MKFKITRANENKFESGVRGFFEYKNLGIEEALNQNAGLQNGLNISKGEIKHQAVSEALS